MSTFISDQPAPLYSSISFPGTRYALARDMPGWNAWAVEWRAMRYGGPFKPLVWLAAWGVLNDLGFTELAGQVHARLAQTSVFWVDLQISCFWNVLDSDDHWLESSLVDAHLDFWSLDSDCGVRVLVREGGFDLVWGYSKGISFTLPVRFRDSRSHVGGRSHIVIAGIPYLLHDTENPITAAERIKMHMQATTDGWAHGRWVHYLGLLEESKDAAAPRE